MTTLVVALLLAVPAAGFVVWPWLGRRATPEVPGADDERAALETEKAVTLRALRELALDHEAGHLADDDYATLRARDEARAAAILKRLDALAPRAGRPAAARPAAPPAAASIPWTRQPAVLATAGAGLLTFGVVLGLLVSRFSAPAPPEMAGSGPGPGGPGLAGAAPEAPAGPPGLAGLPGPEAASGPARPLPKEMLQGMLQAAHAALDAGRYQEAITAYKAILKRDPRNVEAITHLGVILGLAGHADGAVEAFDRALAIDPSYAHALWDKGQVLYEQKQDYAGAIAAWERFVQVGPPGPDREQAQTRIREARSRLAAAPTAPPPAARPAPPAPPSGGPPAGSPPVTR